MYNKKVIEWKHRRDILLYQNPVFTEDDGGEIPYVKKRRSNGKRTSYEDMDYQDKIASDKRRKSYYTQLVYEIVDLVIHNELDTFITLTFRENITEYSEAKILWKNFTKRLRYHMAKKGIKLKYVAVHELQKERGEVFHFHVITNIGFLPHSVLQEMWNCGYTYIERPKKSENKKSQEIFASYITKYITKTITEEGTIQIRNHARKIYRSENLEKPKIYKTMTDENLQDVVFVNLEDVMETSSYFIKDYKCERINEVDCIKIRKE